MTRSYHSIVARARLYAETLRYVRPGQLFHRIRRVVASRWAMPGAWEMAGRVGVEPHLDDTFVAPLHYTHTPETSLARADDALAGRFTFLHHAVTYPGRVRWHDATQSQLWRFHLQYFNYAVDLGLAFQRTRARRYWSRFTSVVEEWIADNRPPRGDGWHPFPLSLRIVNWIRAYHLFGEVWTAHAEFRARVLRWLYLQVRYLARRLEYDVAGNHLIKNAKALVVAGAFFRDREASRWFETGVHILCEEAREQILEDGGHYERSPLYHVQVLSDYLECLALIPPGREESSLLTDAVRTMIAFIGSVTHPDGTLPLFNDCALSSDPPLEALLRYAEEALGDRPLSQSRRTGRESASGSSRSGPGTVDVQRLSDSGYYVFRAADHFLMLDCGPVCPDHLPAHAHCDLLSLELSVDGRRIITNSGTYQYGAGPWRDAFRGTAAHNTVQIAGEEQSAIWGSFRIGRRARVTEAVVRDTESGPYFRGTYVGFDGNRMEHTRELLVLPGSCWVVMDTVRRRQGTEAFTVHSRLHFAPQVHVETARGEARVRREGVGLRVLPLGGEGWQASPGWFSPDFGVKEAAPGLLLSAHGGPIVRLGFVVAPEPAAAEVQGFHHDGEKWRVQLFCNGHVFSIARPL